MKHIPLKEACYIISRGKRDYKEDESSEIRAIRYADIHPNGDILYNRAPRARFENEYETLKLYSVEKNDIVFPTITRLNLSIKKIADTNIPYTCVYTHTTIFVRVNPTKCNSEFLYKLLSSTYYRHRLLNIAYSGASRKPYLNNNTFQISVERLSNIEIPDISIEEQENFLKQVTQKEKKIDELELQLADLYHSLL